MVLTEVASLFQTLPTTFLQFGSIYDVFNQAEYFGVFDLILPFLLIFAVVFGILAATGILGGNKGVSVIISLVIALMALRLQFVSVFFTEIFPRFAIGLISLVIVVILISLFIPREQVKGWYIAFGIVGAIIGLIIIAGTFNSVGYFGSFFWQEWASTIIFVVLTIAALVGIIISVNGPPRDKDGNRLDPPTEVSFPIGRIR